MILKISTLILSLITCPTSLEAGPHPELREKILQSLKEIVANDNFDAAQVYKGQKAGYITGGGFTVRNKSSNLQPATITLPRIDAGCGGIDVYTGGLSFVDGDQIVDTLKSVMSASKGYAFMLALESVSPQMAGTVAQMQTWANTINSSNINSCEAAAQLVGFAWPQSDMASQHICQTIGTNKGYLRDRVSERHQCGSQEKRQESNENYKKQIPNYDMDYNVAWDAIRLCGAIVKDDQLKELLMSLMGTIIVRGEDIEVFPPKASDDAFIRMMMDGGENRIYKCNDKQCLDIAEISMKIDKTNSWVGHVETLLIQIQKMILIDEEIYPESFELLMRCRIPLYRYISLLTAYKKSVCPIEMRQMAEVVAMDVLSKFLRDSLESVRNSCLRLRQKMPMVTKIDDYIASLEFVERSLNNYDVRISRSMQQEDSIFHKMDMLEKWLEQELRL